MNEEKKPLMITYNGEGHMGLTITPEKLEQFQKLLGRYPKDAEMRILLTLSTRSKMPLYEGRPINIAEPTPTHRYYARCFLKQLEQEGYLRVIDSPATRPKSWVFAVALANMSFKNQLLELTLSNQFR